MLEDHAAFAAPPQGQGLTGQSGDVLAVDDDAAGRGLDQAVAAPHEGGLAAAGQAHDDHDLAFLHGEGDIGHADSLSGLGQNVFFRAAAAEHIQCFSGSVPENLHQIFDGDFIHAKLIFFEKY